MKVVHFIFILLLLPRLAFAQPAGVGALATSSPTIAVQIDSDLSSPRQTMKLFLDSMQAVSEGAGERLSDAARCLDLSDLPLYLHQSQGRELASKLFAVLNRTRIVKLDKIPDRKEGDPFVFRDDGEGYVAIELTPRGWLFSQTTMRRLPDLYRSLESVNPVKGAVTGKEAATFAGRIRQQLPAELREELFGLEGWQWAGLLASVIIALCVRFLTIRGLTLTAPRFLRLMGRKATVAEIRGLAVPAGYFVFGLLLQALLTSLDLPVAVYPAIHWTLVFLWATAVLLLLSRGAGLLVDIFILGSRRVVSGTDALLLPFFRRIGKLIIVIVGTVIILSVLGVDAPGLLAGLGLGGLVVAFAAKDSIENLFGSVTVLLDRPFGLGDSIVIDNIQGVVEQIGLRSTRIRTPGNSLITIPNSKLISSYVDNLGARSYFRINTILSFSYETSLAALKAFIEDVRTMLNQHPKVKKDAIAVHLNNLAQSSLDVNVNIYVQWTNANEEPLEKEAILFAILDIAQRNAVEFAYPTQTLIMKGLPASRSSRKEITS